ncbi:nitroreductase family protein [Pseudoclavibacter helvolus]|uniref:nitroreductase family protein n=1 Tax=Pseudoclavibacter helvolus TaxID=255205 RepID=UPI001428A339|nr:nitroreductase family protein [Pseudoclavibacter helvolus]
MPTSIQTPGREFGRLRFEAVRGSTELPSARQPRIFDHHSARDFDNAFLSRETLAAVASATEDMEGKMPFRSAGALYPTHIFVARRISDDSIEYGYVDSPRRLICWYLATSAKSFSSLWIDEWAGNAPAAFIIAADLSRIVGKYGQRGSRFAALEAGGVALLLGAGASGLSLSSCRFGGYYDSSVLAELGLPSDVFVVADTLILGKPNGESAL